MSPTKVRSAAHESSINLASAYSLGFLAWASFLLSESRYSGELYWLLFIVSPVFAIFGFGLSMREESGQLGRLAAFICGALLILWILMAGVLFYRSIV